MKVQAIDTPQGERYLLLDDDFNDVTEVHEFLKYCDNIGESNTSQKTYCYHLKLYYDYLNIIGIKYDEIFDKKKTGGKGPVKILSDFVGWLQFPDRFNNIIHTDGEVAKRLPVTINSIINAVSKFYDYLSRNKYFEELDIYTETMGNPRFKSFLSELNTRTIKTHSNILKMKVQEKPPKYITKEQFFNIYNRTTNIRNKAIISVLFFTGIRISELIAMRISDINFQENIIYIKKHDNSAIRDAHLKNNSVGYVYVPNMVMKDLMTYINRYRTNDNCDVLFVTLYGTTKGQPLTKGNVEKMIEIAGKKIKIHLTPHMFRHSYAVSHLNSGDELIDVQNNLRHKQIQTTKRYAQLVDDTKKEKAAKYYKEIGIDFSPEDTTWDDIGGKLS